MIIFLALLIEIICTGVIIYESWQMFKVSSFKDKIILSIITFLFMIGLTFSGAFFNAIGKEWDQSPVLAIPLIFVLFTYCTKYIFAINEDDPQSSKLLIQHYFYLFKIWGLSYVISILGFIGFNNIFNYRQLSTKNLSVIFMISTMILFIIVYYISYGFIVFIFSKGHHISERRNRLRSQIQEEKNKKSSKDYVLHVSSCDITITHHKH